eukprot:1831713-Rhodomonas_salina.3
MAMVMMSELLCVVGRSLGVMLPAGARESPRLPRSLPVPPGSSMAHVSAVHHSKMMVRTGLPLGAGRRAAWRRPS